MQATTMKPTIACLTPTAAASRGCCVRSQGPGFPVAPCAARDSWTRASAIRFGAQEFSGRARTVAPVRRAVTGSSRSLASTTVSSAATLFDVPVSNNGANIRLIVYWKGLEEEIEIKSPMDIGGLKSEEYLKINPEGKMPCLLLADGTAFPESAVIANYIADKYAESGPTLIPSTPEARATANLATRIHDVYIASGLQGCMYKAMEIEERAAKMAELAKQMDILEGIIEAGPFIVGDSPSLADAALFPTFVFITEILPTQFGWTDVFASRPKLKAWWTHMLTDESAARVYAEVKGGLDAWAANDRWNKLGICEQVKDTNYKWAY